MRLAEPHVRRLHLGRHTRPRVLVAPVELVGLAAIEAQRHKGLRRRQQPPPPTPGPGVAAHRVVAAAITQSRKVRIRSRDSDPGAASSLASSRRSSSSTHGPSFGILDLALVAERGLIEPPCAPCSETLKSRAIFLIGTQMIPTDPRNRLHNQHLPHLVCPNNKVCSRAQNQGGQFWTPITPNRGSIFHA